MPNAPFLPHLQSTSRVLGEFVHWMAIARPQPASSAMPQNIEEEKQQLISSLQDLQQSLSNAALPTHYCQKIYRLSVFLSDSNHSDEFLMVIQRFFNGNRSFGGSSTFATGKDNTPIVEIIYQAPLSGAPFALEAWGISCCSPDLFQLIHRSENVIEVKYDGLTWSHCANIRPNVPDTLVYPRSLNVFNQIGGYYQAVGIPFEDVIRTWIYLGDIVGPEGETQRYKELNRARTDFFGDTQFCMKYRSESYFGEAYPASTGIGSDGKEVMISAMTFRTERHDAIAVPLENPQQTSAFNYGQNYSPSSPKFARALGVQWGENGLIFISGTASITDAETRFIGDPVSQTQCTLDNIACLIDRANCSQHGFTQFGAELKDLAFARVYIKRAEDYPAIAKRCRELCGDDVPLVFTKTDVCRPELLVEIEGVAFAK